MWAVAPCGRHGEEVKSYLRDMARKKAAHDMPGRSGGKLSASESASGCLRWWAWGSTTPVGSPSAPWVAVRTHTRFLQQCVHHCCLTVAAPSVGSGGGCGRTAGGQAALWRAGGRGWEREFHSLLAVFSDMATHVAGRC